MPLEDARYAAQRAFGNAVRLKEKSHETWSVRWLEEVLQDLRYGLRMLVKRPGFTIHGVSSIQEETGVWGAGTITARLKPDAAVAVDVTHETHHPAVKRQKFGDIRFGAGPVLTRGVRTNKVLLEEIRTAAKEANIPHQMETDQGHTHTDADPISQRMEGVPVAVVSVPCRYMHTSCEVIHLGDLDRAVELLVAVALHLDEKVNLTLR